MRVDRGGLVVLELRHMECRSLEGDVEEDGKFVCRSTSQ